MIDQHFFDVVTQISVLYAIASGILLGAGPFVWLTLRRPPLHWLTTGKQFWLALFVLTLLGGTFFAGQITQAAFEINGVEGLLSRVFGRWFLWEVFSVAVAASHSWALGFARPRLKES